MVSLNNTTSTGQYTVFYDAQCALCRQSRSFIERHAPNVPMQWIDVNDRNELSKYPQIDPHAAQHEVFVLDPTGQLHPGYDAIVELLSTTSGFPHALVPPLRWRLSHRIGNHVYHWVSQHRHGLSRMLGIH